MTTAERTLLTPDDLLTMPDGDRYELVDGQLVERNMGSKAGHVNGRIVAALSQYEIVHGGWTLTESNGYTCFPDDPDRLRRPDASYIAPGRLDEVPDGWITIPSDLVVEVISPNDLYYEVERKVAEDLEAGVRMVWVANPENRTVRVLEPDKSQVTLSAGDDLSGGDVSPGLSISVNSLFPPASPRPSAGRR